MQRFRADDKPPKLIELSGKSTLIPTQKLPQSELELPLPPELPNDSDMEYIESQQSSETNSAHSSRSNSPKPSISASMLQRLKSQSKSSVNSPKPSSFASMLHRCIKNQNRSQSNSPKPSTSASTVQRLNRHIESRGNNPKPSTPTDHTYSIDSFKIDTGAEDKLFWTSDEILTNNPAAAIKDVNVKVPASEKVAELVEEWLEEEEMEDVLPIYVLDDSDDFAGFDSEEPIKQTIPTIDLSTQTTSTVEQSTRNIPIIESVKSLAASVDSIATSNNAPIVEIPMRSQVLGDNFTAKNIHKSKFNSEQNGSLVHKTEVKTDKITIPGGIMADNDATLLCKKELLIENEPLEPAQSSFVIKEEPEFVCPDITSKELQQFNDQTVRQPMNSNGKPPVMIRKQKKQQKTPKQPTPRPHISCVPPTALMPSPGPYPVNLIAVNPTDHNKMQQRAPPPINRTHHVQSMRPRHPSPLITGPSLSKPLQNVHSSAPPPLLRQPLPIMTRNPSPMSNKSANRNGDIPHIIGMMPKKKPSENETHLSLTSSNVPVPATTKISQFVMSEQMAVQIGLSTNIDQSPLTLSLPPPSLQPPVVQPPPEKQQKHTTQPLAADEPLSKRRKTNKNELKSEIKKLRLALLESDTKNGDLTRELTRQKFHCDQAKSQLKELIRVNIILSGQINPDCQCYSGDK